MTSQVRYARKCSGTGLSGLVRGAGASFVFRSAGVGLQFFFNYVLARWLGADGVGLFYLAFTVTTIGSTIARVGLDNTILKAFSARSSEGDSASIGPIYRTGFRIVLVGSLLVGATTWLGAETLALNCFHEPRAGSAIQGMAFLVCPYSLLWFFSYCMQSLERIAYAQFLQSVCGQFLGFSVVLFLHYERTLDVGHLARGYTASTCVAAGIGWWLFSKAGSRAGIFAGGGQIQVRKLLKLAKPQFVSSLMQVSMVWAPMLTLGIFSPSVELGGYQIANRSAQLITFFFMAVNSIAAPRFSALHQRKDWVSLERTAQHATALSTALCAPLVIIFVVWPEGVMGLFGESFRGYWLALVCLTSGQLLYVSMGSVSYLLMMAGEERTYQKIAVLSAAVVVVGCFCLVPAYGATGAAVASAVGLATNHALAAVAVWKRLGISSFPLINRVSV